jgi:ketosteroid isomerase-like protein
MSENLELVLGLYPGPDVDYVQLFGDEKTWAATRAAVARFIHPDFECAVSLLGREEVYGGPEGLRALFLDWYAPWVTYRIEVEDAIDLGERVLVLYHSFGRLEGSSQEVEEASATVWTIRHEGKVARAVFYTNRAEALKAVGLQE